MVASLRGEVKPLVLFSFLLAYHLEWDINKPTTLFKKSRGRRPCCHGLCDLSRHWSGWVRWDQTWKWQHSAPLHADVWSHLCGSSTIQPLAASKESWHPQCCCCCYHVTIKNKSTGPYKPVQFVLLNYW